MNIDRLDPRAIDKTSGPSWQDMRPTFNLLNDVLLSTSSEAKGELTTIYIKYTSPETGNQPYAVLWIKRASELTLGLALPEGVDSTQLVPAPRGCKYAGLTRYLVLKQGDELPEEIQDWTTQAYNHVKQ